MFEKLDRNGFTRPLLPVMRWVVRRLVRFTTVPEVPQALGLDPQRPVVYALHLRQISALLVLEQAARRLDLPSPLTPLAAAPWRERTSFFFLTRSGQPSPLQPNPYVYSQRLERLVAAAREALAFPAAEGERLPTDVQVVPVSIFWGRSPAHQDSIVRALLADAWVVPGALRQGLRLLFHGRHTLVRFGQPISLRGVVEGALAEGLDERTTLRRMARMLRAEFRSERELVVGPDLSHRHTLLNAVITAPAVQTAIQAEAQDKARPEAEVELRARRLGFGIASHYSHAFIRAYELALTWLWNRIYSGVEVHRFDDAAAAGTGAELVWVPCHRSHVDYLLLSWVVFRRGLQPPHIAAGNNLDLPLVGPLLRRGGAFFLRRSFKGDALYGAVFAEYLHAILSRGFPIEYFVEGGRSRSGRMLPPRAGILGMTVDSYLRGIRRPLVFVPVYIGYEQLIEADSYIAELAGKPKRKESLVGVLRSVRALRRQFGRVHVNIGEPIPLGRFLDETWSGWRETGMEPLAPQHEGQRQAVTRELARTIVSRINEALVVNAVNLVAIVLLGAPRGAVDVSRLTEQIDLLRHLLATVPYSARQVVTDMDAAAVVAHVEALGIVERVPHPLGDILRVVPRQAPMLAYFRNNVLHAFALPGLVAGLLARNERLDVERLVAIARGLLPFLRAELFIAGDDAALELRLRQYLAVFHARGLLLAEGALLAPPAPSQPESAALAALAGILRQPLGRYALVVTTLARFGSGVIGARRLEDSCVLLAQRMALLHETASPDFSDRAPLRAIIETLAAEGMVTEDNGVLGFTPALAESAQVLAELLPAEVRLALAQIGQVPEETVARAVAERGIKTA